MLKQKALKYILIASCLVALGYPLVHMRVIFPAYENLLVRYAEDDSARVARHLSSMFGLREGGRLDRGSLPDGFGREVERIRRDLGIERIKVFSASGEVIFSTAPGEVGEVNDRGYFREVVARGRTFTKFVSRDSTTLEGRPVRADVVETYVPVMGEGGFSGAFEIYYDVTRRSEALRGLAVKYSAVPFAITVLFIVALTVVMLRLEAGGKGMRYLGLPAVLSSPVHLLLLWIAAIFLAEMVVVFLLSAFPPMSRLALAVLNATFLVMIVGPAVYFFFLDPVFVHFAERRKAERKLEELSITDELTGLLNRRGFFTFARKLLESSRRTGSEVLVLFADLNDLKWINDHLGHDAGDEALKDVASILKGTFRDADVLGRMGGDEFAVLAVNPPDGGAAGAVESRLRKAAGEHPAMADGLYRLSLSIGSAVCRPGEHCSVDELLNRADRRMYKDKEHYRRTRDGVGKN